MFDNYQSIEQYRQSIINLTNNCGLTPGMAFYVLKDVMHELHLVYQEERHQDFSDQTHTQEVIVNSEGELVEELSLQELEEEIKHETE